MFKRAKIKNFRKIDEQDIEFSKGVNLVVGGNYRGKTTILDAIAWAMTGGHSHNSMWVKPVESEGKTSVEVEFAVSGDDYRVHRSSSGAELYKNGSLLATGRKEVSSAVSEIIGIDPKLFPVAVYRKQKQAESLATGGFASVQKAVNDITGSSDLVKIFDNIKANMSAANALRNLEMPDVVDTVLKIHNLEEGIRECKERCNECSDALAKRVETATLKKVELKQVQDRNQIAESVRAKREVLHKQIDEIRKAAESDLDTKIDAIIEERDFIVEILDTCKEGSKIQLEYERAEANMPDVAKGLQMITVRAKTGVDLDEMQKAVDQEKEEIGTLTRKLDENSKGICSSCNRAFDNHTPLHPSEVKTINDRLASLRDSIQSKLKEIRSITTSRGKMEVEKKRYEEARARVGAMRHAMEQLMKDLPPEIAEGINWHQEVISAQHKLKMLDKTLDSAKSVREKKLQLAKLKTELDKLPDDVAVVDVTEMEKQVDRLSAEIESLKLEINTLTSKEVSDSSMVSVLHRNLKKDREMLAKINEAAKRYDMLRSLQNFLKEHGKKFSDSVWATVMSLANNYVNYASNGSVTALTYADGKSQMFEFVDDKGNSLPVELASGAQRSAIGVSLQMAITGAVGCPLNSVMMDEVTADADDQTAVSVMRMLKDTGSQVIAVTHREYDSAIADNVVEV